MQTLPLILISQAEFPINTWVASGATALGLSLAILWLFIRGTIAPTAPQKELYLAEREGRLKAEEREREAYQRIDRCLDALEAAIKAQASTKPAKGGGN